MDMYNIVGFSASYNVIHIHNASPWLLTNSGPFRKNFANYQLEGPIDNLRSFSESFKFHPIFLRFSRFTMHFDSFYLYIRWIEKTLQIIMSHLLSIKKEENVRIICRRRHVIKGQCVEFS